MTRLLLDMGLPRGTASDLRANGRDAIHAGELGLARSADVTLLELAAAAGRVVVTLDRDLARIAVSTHRRLPSVILLRHTHLNRPRATGLLCVIIPSLIRHLGSGCIVSVTPGRVHIRPLPVRRSVSE